jgi:hypothetical protein
MRPGLPDHDRACCRQALRRQPQLGRHQQHLFLARPRARCRRRHPDAVPALRRPQGARPLRRFRARRLSARVAGYATRLPNAKIQGPKNLVATLERAEIARVGPRMAAAANVTAIMRSPVIRPDDREGRRQRWREPAPDRSRFITVCATWVGTEPRKARLDGRAAAAPLTEAEGKAAVTCNTAPLIVPREMDWTP